MNMIMITIAKIAAACGILGVGVAFLPPSHSYSTPQRHAPRAIKRSRRGFLSSAAAAAASATAFLPAAETADAFENRLDGRYADAPATPGAQPKDLGVLARKSRAEGSYVGLKACGNSPNCWASSNPYADLPGRTISGWNGGSIKDVKKVIDTYEVGQNGIDGGGFKVMEYDEKGQYLYVQFQSYKAGYIDDFECWFNPKSGKFDVRSSSRVGYSDLGVNSARLEYIAGRLEKEFKWTFERSRNGLLD
mmetsp:Transcript_37689/g.80517  ORF Transcript_37689/g.80517 Transcript_37689/m.80517 type:complete len:248 (-) Transcript_37689:67-810(-)